MSSKTMRYKIQMSEPADIIKCEFIIKQLGKSQNFLI